ncbi:hypothetical protein KSS87_003386 [Heliosperma pusillum]|nr:hypothetical protein KSS87_003386 [Heliosperma pusillum]
MGWMGHDSAHYQAMVSPWWNRLMQSVFGNCLTGVGASWWKWTHNAHHIACNALEFDPDVQLMPFLASFSLLFSNRKVIHKNREIFALLLFWVWYPLLVSYLPNWFEKMTFVVISLGITGVQHFQFSLNHLSCDVYTGPLSGDDWFQKQTIGSLDIECPSWMDWFHGGLQFQIEHHLFPRMPRCHLRKISSLVKGLCNKHHIPYKCVSFWKANNLTFTTLRIAALEARNPTNSAPRNLVWEAMTSQGFKPIKSTKDCKETARKRASDGEKAASDGEKQHSDGEKAAQGRRESGKEEAAKRRVVRSFTTSEGHRPAIVNKRSLDILHDPWLDLRGLLPPNVMTSEQQIDRFMADLKRLEVQAKDGPSDPNALAKWRILNRLHDRNETMYYKVLIANIAEYAPIVYTPTVGLVCQNYSGLYRRPRGMYFSSADRGEMMSMVYNWPAEQVDMIVVTDGSRILGLGDQGVQGIGIAIGKLDLYVAAAGINPQRVLPVMIDVGTNNEKLLKDPLCKNIIHISKLTFVALNAFPIYFKCFVSLEL